VKKPPASNLSIAEPERPRLLRRGLVKTRRLVLNGEVDRFAPTFAAGAADEEVEAVSVHPTKRLAHRQTLLLIGPLVTRQFI
jgi:hypothetical protein